MRIDRKAIGREVFEVLATQLSPLVPKATYPVIGPAHAGLKTALQVMQETDDGSARYRTESYYHAVVHTIYARVMDAICGELDRQELHAQEVEG